MTTHNLPILLAEDNRNDAELILLVLGKLDKPQEVVVVCDGAEALDYLCYRGHFQARPKGQPILVLLDLKMPKVDGFEVLTQMKRDPQLKLIPVVVFTSSREAEDVLRCYELGANSYVVKPVDFHEFTSTIKEIVAFWTATNEPVPKSAGTANAQSPQKALAA